MHRNALSLFACLALSSTVLAQDGAHLRTWAATLPQGGMRLVAELEGASGSEFLLLASPTEDGSFDPAAARPIGRRALTPDGSGRIELDFEPGRLPEGLTLALRAAFPGSGRVGFSADATLPLNGVAEGMAFLQVLDFDFALGADEPQAGQVIDDEYAAAGLNISALNNFGPGPDLAIIFDSANPTGGDFDLATPGSGPGNTQAWGKVLICAENDIDMDGDGFIDTPDDEAFGSRVRFDFDLPVSIFSITVLDVDDTNPSEVRFEHEDGSIDIIPAVNLGDNSAQTLSFVQDDVVRMEVAFGGSGAVAEVQLEPCPLLVNMDETVFGRPRGLLSGQEITNQFSDLGLTIDADNAAPGHPDKVILFDSENPTGGDQDLMTPGPGVNNDTPLGLVLIMAENDIDMDGDGRVDDPDDEAMGGLYNFRFAQDITFLSATVLDVDGTEFDEFRFYDANDVLTRTINIGSLGDNSVQTLTLGDMPVPDVRRIELQLIGSGAVTRLRWCPQ